MNPDLINQYFFAVYIYILCALLILFEQLISFNSHLKKLVFFNENKFF